MKYLKHKYSKRVYQVREDHGPNRPELVFQHQVRCPTPERLRMFFIPVSESSNGGEILVSIPQEIEWENRKLKGDKPLEVRTPTQQKKGGVKRKGKTKTKTRTRETPISPKGKDGYTLVDLCQELGITPSMARRLLRSKGKSAPAGGWKWANPEEARPIKKIIKNLL